MRFIALVTFALCLQAGFFILFPKSQSIPASSDLVMVFPGGAARVATGFKLANGGYAPNLAISGTGSSGLQALMKKYGRSEGVRLLSGGKSRSTIEDALVMRRIVQEHRFKSVLLVTSAYHMPRAYLIARLFLLGTGAKLSFFVVPDSHPLEDRSSRFARCKIMVSEMVQLWGSGAELGWYLATGILPRDIPTLKEISLFMKKSVLPSVEGE